MEYRVSDHPDLRKDSRGFVINRNQEEYEKALKRAKSIKAQKSLERRMDVMEDTLEKILNILQGRT